MPRYDFTDIESRWQHYWDENRTFHAPGPGEEGFDPKQPKFYVLDMFPYPSGAGLHVGHPKGYTATDVLSRFLRMRGYNVLHPIGWDSFGLPAEQYAIQTGTHPAETTAANIVNFTSQLKALGFSYDWQRELATTDVDYYRWTQWIFTKLYERGLAYQAEVPVWWCEALGTVLANEEVIDGRSERGDHPCVRRPLRQWMLKITAYAERLLADLEDLDWPESVKAMQREWIGRSEGGEIDFQVEGHSQTFTVFTTRPDTLFGATFCTLSPEHPLVEKVTGSEQRAAVEAYRLEASRKSDLERTALAKDKSGVFTGAFALNPVYPEGDPRRRMPIYVADYVLMSYGTGAIMAVPGGDERDFDFAVEHDLPIVQIVEPPSFPKDPAEAEKIGLVRQTEHQGQAAYCFTGVGRAIHSDFLNGLAKAEAVKAMIEWLQAQDCGRPRVTYRLRDWLFSRQRYWGEPFPVLHGEDGEVKLVDESDLPVSLPALDDFKPTSSGDPPLARATDWLEVVDADGKVWKRETNSMPQWAGSCWYYLRFCDPKNQDQAWSQKAENYWMPVDFYVGGAEHAVLHLLYARFWHKVLFDCGLVSTSEPFQKLVNQGMVQSFAFKDRRGALIPVDRVEEREEGHYFDQESGEPVERLIAKMSKSLRNVVTPDSVIQEFGADTIRLYSAFMGPVTASAPWNPRDLPGVHRFLQRTWRLFVPEEEDGPPLHPWLLEQKDGDEEVERALHKAIAKTTEDLEQLALNTAIAAMMEFVNVATRKGGRLSRSQAERFTLLLSPFASHLAEELWSKLGHNDTLAYEPWPEFDPAMLVEDTLDLPVQINGKVRARIQVPRQASREQVEETAMAEVGERLEGLQVRKVVVVPGRLVNLVVAKS
ncbi:MAG: leucine--tRNA ligase [Planctomycetota bacterium]|nr:MAG: leucine--tRNA ligase [Planctomycetota bacterium]